MPLPQTVCFPGQKLPLQIFEPRYRRMIRDCDRLRIPVGICLPQATISDRELTERTTRPLNNDLSLYSLNSVFAVGRLEVKETLSDGRILIEIDFFTRVRIKKYIQQLPYYIVDTDVLEDEESSRYNRGLFNELLELAGYWSPWVPR